MSTPFDILPIDLQSIVLDMRAANLDASLIDSAIERMLSALVAKSNKVQVQVWQIEEHLGQQLTQIGDKLQADLQTQHGATNGMLIELRSAQQLAHPQIDKALLGIAEIKKNWNELAEWRGRIEGRLIAQDEFREDSTADRTAIRDAIHEMDERHGGQITELTARLSAIEQLLKIAGAHDRREAAGG